MVQLESNVPVPGPKRHKFPKVYPWDKMSVGDSFLHPGNRSAATAAMWYAAKRYGHKYRSRREGAGYRIWRIA